MADTCPMALPATSPYRHLAGMGVASSNIVPSMSLDDWYDPAIGYDLLCLRMADTYPDAHGDPAAPDTGGHAQLAVLIFFLPIPGLLLYLAIGRPRFPRWRGQRFETAASILAPRLRPLLCVDAPGEAAMLAAKLGGFPAVSGNTVELLGDYDGTVDRLVQDIDGARFHVRLLVYIFADDATGSRVAAALARAVERGVAVHVMFDPVGTHRWKKGALAMLAATGAQVREALPFHWLRERTRRDMRNHRKLFLIDGKIGYAGSQNIVDKGFRTGVENRELVARMTGPAVAEMTAIFLSDWFLETEVMLDDTLTIPASTGNAQAQLLPSGANYPLEGFQTLLIGQLHRAVRRVVITSPYFIPDESLLEAMRTAVLRGVEVDLIVSAVVDQPLVSLAQRSYYDDILRGDQGSSVPRLPSPCQERQHRWRTGHRGLQQRRFAVVPIERRGQPAAP
jgi:cardiolipin synthase